MIPWTPIDPETPLRELVTMRCFADSEAGRALILQVRPPYYAGGSSPGRKADEVRVESRASFGWQRP